MLSKYQRSPMLDPNLVKKPPFDAMLLGPTGRTGLRPARPGKITALVWFPR